MKSLNETIKEGETKKRTLEETLDSLQEKVTPMLETMNFMQFLFVTYTIYLVWKNA